MDVGRYTYDQIPEALSEASRRRHAEQAQRRAGRFLKGPIPLSWLQQAAKLPGKAVAVSLILWFLAGVRRSARDIRVSRRLAQEFGVGRKARYRALVALERAGLIAVQRHSGQSPRITIKTEVVQCDKRH